MYLMLIAILSAVVGGVLLFWAIKSDTPVSKTVERMIICFLLFTVIVGGIWVGCACSATEARSTFADEYNQLKLYQHTVEASTNEYLRFDYYNRVQDWNEKYNTYLEMGENPWIDWFLFDPMRYCKPIDFELHGDMVNVEG